MEALVTSKSNSPNSGITGKVILIACLLAALAVATSIFVSQPLPSEIQLKMEKSAGKNGKHANFKARESAEQEYQRIKDQLQEWNKKPNKTPEDKDFIKKLRKLLERLRQKKDFSGENHSQKNKGF
jgi:5-bromo-4-chloroindolyl phosphate hydrolysis protein